MITLEQYAMGRDVEFPEDWELVKSNAEIMLEKVNAFLSDMFPGKSFKVRSGWRPESINAATKGASKKSTHIIALGIDLDDSDGFFKKYLRPLENNFHADKLRQYGLFMEHPDHTPTWCHLDCGSRVDRPTRVFAP